MLTLKDAFNAFGYTLSLPERFTRSAVAALGGASKALTDTLIPEPLRNTNTYTSIVGNAQRFLIEKVAEVQGVYAQSKQTLPQDFVQRSVAGNIISTAGVLSIHLSPLWVFALASDVADGSKEYLGRLVKELKESKVLDENTDVKNVDELLDAVASAGKHSAQVFDLPPVNTEQITKLREQITSGYARVFQGATNLLPRMDDLWKKMEGLAMRDNVAMESVVGLMTVDLGRTAGRTVDAAFAVGNVTADLISEKILQSYGETIDRMQRQGVVSCMEEAAKPYLQAISGHLSTDKQSWTEWALGKLWNPLFGDPPPDKASQSPTDCAQ
jgi:hypothetical protein